MLLTETRPGFGRSRRVPQHPHDRGYVATREQATADFKHGGTLLSRTGKITLRLPRVSELEKTAIIAAQARLG